MPSSTGLVVAVLAAQVCCFADAVDLRPSLFGGRSFRSHRDTAAASGGGGSLNDDDEEQRPLWVDALSKKGRMTVVSPLFRFQQAQATAGASLDAQEAAMGLDFGRSGAAATDDPSSSTQHASYTGHPLSGYHWEVPFPMREEYPEGAYTLSGGIFESVIEDTCQRMAQRSKSGWCQPPCQMEPDDKRLPSYRNTKSCLVMPYVSSLVATTHTHTHTLYARTHALPILARSFS